MKFPLLAKAAAIGLLILLLLAVMQSIGGLVDERRSRQQAAIGSVAQSLAEAQTLVGPLLQRRCTEEWDTIEGEGQQRRTVTAKREITLTSAPHALAVDTDARAEARYRGLFKVNGYNATSSLKARWNHLAELQPQREHKGSRLHCEAASLWLAVTDPRGIREAKVQVDGAPLEVRPGTGHESQARGFRVVLAADRAAAADTPLEAVVSLALAGTARLSLVPAADQAQWTMRSDWPHPSFGGRFLPAPRQVRDDGFTAQWAVSALASPAAAEVERGGTLCPVVDRFDGAEDMAVVPPPAAIGSKVSSCVDTIDVSFIEPVNPYSLTDRATKYAMLFIVLTFAAVALTEVMAGVRVHPVQYGFVGLALALFYLLLIGLSEHIAFGVAYALGSAACVTLLGFYACHMLGSRRAGVLFGSGIALLYGLLWTLLRMERWSLAVGSVMLFAILAAVMVLTRRIDWHRGLGAGKEAPPAAA